MDLFPPHHLARTTDPNNSKEAAKQNRGGRWTARVRLLQAYTMFGELTDAEAGEHAKVPTAHKRCSELLKTGMIEVVGDKRGPSGALVRVCRATEFGRATMASITIKEGASNDDPTA